MNAIDSMILIYAGIVPQNPKHQVSDELQVRAKLLLYKMAQAKPPIFLATIAVSELLVPVPASQRGNLITRLSECFVCAPFDLHASAIAADLLARSRNMSPDLNYENRHVLRADILILASVKSAGATEFYTNDAKCRSLADLIMKGCDLPMDDPDDMFLKGDIRRGQVPPIESELRKRSTDQPNN